MKQKSSPIFTPRKAAIQTNTGNDDPIKSHKTGRVFHIQRFSVNDGPGVRTVVFLSGCPLRCLWCHTPEGLTADTKIFFDPQKCIGCFRCVDVCPNACHCKTDGMHRFDRARCTACGACADACPSCALTVSGRSMTADEVMKDALRDKAFFRRGGGGITLSGGEPLLQAEFAKELLRGARDSGVSTCVETCGHVQSEKFAALLPLIDTLYFDYKATEDAHIRLTGVSQELILNNLAAANENHSRIVLRCPLIPERNMNEEHYRGIAETVNKYESIYEIHLEPYHSLGESKARQLSLMPAYSGKAPEKETVESARDFILAHLTRPVPVMIG